MPTTIRFLDTVIRNLKPSNSRDTYWCDGCPGFGLRITPTGRKSFVYKYMHGRKSRWITIGRYPEWSIRRARREYDKLYEQVHAYGRDPIAEKKALEAAQNARETVESLTESYLEIGRLKNKSSIEEEERYFRQDILPVIGNKMVDEVSAEDIDKIQRRIIDRARNRTSATRNGLVAAKHAVACARRLFNLAVKRRKCAYNPVKEIEILGITGKRDRVLTLEEIWRFWNTLDRIGLPPVTAAALKFALVTMQRSAEIRNMRYASLKLEENVWQMETHETKSRTMHRVPLNRYALDLIEQMEPYTAASPYVFGATRAMSPPQVPARSLEPFGKTAFSQAVRRSRDLLGIENICPHDLRRTGATWITAVGLPKLYARLMLNHSDGDRDVTGEVYVQYSYDFEKQRAAQVWEYVLDAIVSAPRIEDVPKLEVLRERIKRMDL
ncbi:site-specific integrase [Accumulibacter sp.]|uniref:tyrosine-type recombinase/integrase n=1 Tax=Accumulibacter sp. TaxID=2053492 RepID=UPI0025F93BCC|nr:site-specific integrase [Accumulibacter sp.]MCP5230238.1 site-specific integrase [Accumulibacter sp.]